MPRFIVGLLLTALTVPSIVLLSLETIWDCSIGYGFDCPPDTPEIVSTLAAFGLVTSIPWIITVVIYVVFALTIAIIRRRP